MEMEILRLQILQAALGAAGDSWRTGTPGDRCSNPLFTTSETSPAKPLLLLCRKDLRKPQWQSFSIFQQDRSTWASATEWDGKGHFGDVGREGVAWLSRTAMK